MSGVIYGLKGKFDGRVYYVGQTSRPPENRWRAHRSAKTPAGKNLKLLFGDMECFEFVILETVDGTHIDLDAREVFWIGELNTLMPHGVNQIPGGLGGNRHPFARRMNSERMKRLCADPVFQAKISASRKKQWTDPEYRARVIEGMLAVKATPEHKAKLSTIKKAMWERPGHRENVSSKTANQWTDPEMKARMSAAIRATRRAQSDDPVKRAEMLATRRANKAARESAAGSVFA